MTAQDFIEKFSLQRAKKMHDELLANCDKRPKSYTFQIEETGGRHTINFFGCPYRLKDKKMVNWLHSILLLSGANDTENEFSAEDRLYIGLTSINEQLLGSFNVIDIDAFPETINRWVKEANDYATGIDVMVQIKDTLFDWFDDEKNSDEVQYQSWVGFINCAVFVLYYSIKAETHNEYTDWAIDQLLCTLHAKINAANENEEEPDFTCESQAFETLVHMIPMIEESGDKALLHKVYAFAADYYRATHRDALADKYNIMAGKKPSNEEVSTFVNSLLIEMLGVNPEDVVPNADLIDNLEADRIDLVEIMMAIEKEYPIIIEERDILDPVTNELKDIVFPYRTVGDLILQ